MSRTRSRSAGALRAPRPRGARGAGSALVEALVALTVLAVGVLAVAASSAPLVRRLADGARARRATALLDERIERLRADTCPAAAAGTRAVDALTERWAVARDGRLATLADTVRLPASRGPRDLGAQAVRWCAP